MKKVTWMEVAIAMPMVLTLSTAGGKILVITLGVVMLAAMAAIKWGKNILIERKQHTELVWIKVKSGH